MSTTSRLHPSTLGVVVCDVPPECLVAVAGELDVASAVTLAHALRRLEFGCEVVTLDLRALTFMDVAGLHAVLDARRWARATGRRLQILGPVGEVARVLDLTRTRGLFS